MFALVASMGTASMHQRGDPMMRRLGLGMSHAVCALLLLGVALVRAEDEKANWINLTDQGLKAWKLPNANSTADWAVAGQVRLSEKNPKRLEYDAGDGILVNGPKGSTANIVTRESFGDVELHLEFFIPKGSNSGVKLEGLYEVQIADSYGKPQPKASDCGGVYPRAELLPRYHYLDEGHPPTLNAARPAGEWQTLDIVFHAPRFDDKGSKTANARFDKVVLNGQVVHESLELATPTGHAWKNREVASAPILLQADHGPVAFRNIRVRRLP